LARRDDLESARKKRGQGSIVDARGGILPPSELESPFTGIGVTTGQRGLDEFPRQRLVAA
jgi:hypothetical protein